MGRWLSVSFHLIWPLQGQIQGCLLNIFRRKMFGPPFAISRGVRCFAAISIHARGVWGRMFLCAHTPTLTTTHVCVRFWIFNIGGVDSLQRFTSV